MIDPLTKATSNQQNDHPYIYTLEILTYACRDVEIIDIGVRMGVEMATRKEHPTSTRPSFAFTK
jgi:hypothetical protein